MKLKVEAANGCYDIIIEKNILQDALIPDAGNYAVVTDSNVYELYAKQLDREKVIVLPAGEGSKNFMELERILDNLLQMGMNRNDTLIALGGGVIGDIAGFAAAIYKRGISFVQVPTTLLAMVDSSVGGKVAVNLPGGKNMAGAFYQPEAVFADACVLDTLDSRQYAAGMAEVIKYGYIADSLLLEKLKRNEYEIESVIYDCCRIKAAYVEEDPYDKGVRMQLNYGHTIGHAVETVAGYGKYLHGEAVAIGMLAAARLGEALGISPAGLADETAALLKQYALPHTLDRALLAEAAGAIAKDKKAADGKVDFVLIDRPGHAVTEPLDITTITQYMTGQKNL